eukprot:827163-Pelagomonas_calceolata.AAC.1
MSSLAPPGSHLLQTKSLAAAADAAAAAAAGPPAHLLGPCAGSGPAQPCPRSMLCRLRATQSHTRAAVLCSVDPFFVASHQPAAAQQV